MPGRTAAFALTLALAAHAAASACPPTPGGDAAACNAARPARLTTALCAAAAQTAETCADRTTGIVHAFYLVRSASEWRKAALAKGRRDASARRWLAHAMVLDERVQDDPGAPRALRLEAARDEALARAQLRASTSRARSIPVSTGPSSARRSLTTIANATRPWRRVCT